MADTEKTPATLLDELAALEPARRRELAKQLRKVAETFGEVPDGLPTHSGCWPTGSTRPEPCTQLGAECREASGKDDLTRSIGRLTPSRTTACQLRNHTGCATSSAH